MKKIALHNLGCKVNSYELDGICQDFARAGYEIVDFDKEADIYIINTCSVTNIADRKSRQMIHKARKENPNAVIAALGCYVQGRDDIDKDIDIVIGNNLKAKCFEIVTEYLNTSAKAQERHVLDLKEAQEYEEITVEESNEHTRAFIKIQDGCDQYCSYCIIAHVRGHIRSRNAEDVYKEITALTKKGYKEFVLTGIHLSSYGLDGEGSYNDFAKSGRTNYRLLEVIRGVAAIDGVARIRLGSLEPRLLTEEFLEELSKVDKLCHHFHLSLQSGSDEVLRRMNRHYSAAEFEEVVLRIRKVFKHPAITTDVIVGFPGESEEEFRQTKEFLTKIKLYETHLFKFSRRKGTAADKMSGQLSDKQKSERSLILQKINDTNKADFISHYLGKEMEVILEDMELIDGREYMVGYSREYVKLACPLIDNETEERLEGKIINVVGLTLVNGIIICKRV